MGAAQEMNLGHFLKTLILSFVWPLQDRKHENPMFPAVLGVFALGQKNTSLTPTSTKQKAAPKMKDLGPAKTYKMGIS